MRILVSLKTSITYLWPNNSASNEISTNQCKLAEVNGGYEVRPRGASGNKTIVFVPKELAIAKFEEKA